MDVETGYYFYNARYYEAEIGRFITADNVIDGEYSTQGWNRFAYVKNNPVRYKDPSGNFKDTSYDSSKSSDEFRDMSLQGEVEEGDNLWDISKEMLEAYGRKGAASPKRIRANINRIKEINGLKTDKIKPGQKLNLGRYKLEKDPNSIGLQDDIVLDFALVGVGAAKNALKVGPIVKSLLTGTGKNILKNQNNAKLLVKNPLSKHVLDRLTERGISQKMVSKALEKGEKFYDPKNKTINYVLKNGFASGKDLLVGTNMFSGKVTTAIRGSDLVSKRFIRISNP